MSDLRDYLAAKLAADGYDGLAGDCCGCELDDLMPCQCNPLACAPGHKTACTTASCSEFAHCGLWGGEWCMRPGRQP